METAQNIRLDKYLAEAIKKSASDLHLVIGSKPTLRIDKELVPLEEEEVMNEDIINEIVVAIIPNEQQKVLEEKREARMVYNFFNKVRCILNIYYQRSKLSISVKIISSKIATMEELGLPRLFYDFLDLKKGLILLAGTYYSGRSASVMSLLERINATKKKHIVTLEDPIEQMLYSKESIVEQREVGKDVLSLKNALEDIRESDVDILALLNMPLDRSIKSVIELSEAMTVIGVVNGDSTAEVLDKVLMNFSGLEQQALRNIIAEALEGIVVQKLVPRIGGGLIAVFETVKMNAPIKTLVREGKHYNIKNILLNSLDERLISFDKSLAALVRQGEIQFEVAYQEASDRDLFQSLIRK